MAEESYNPAVQSHAQSREAATAAFARIMDEMKTVVVATVDDEGKPVTCVIDLMGYDEDGLYLITNAGKGFYNRLKSREYLSLSTTNGKPTMECVAVTVAGEVRECPQEKLAQLLEANPFMYELYPTEEKRSVLRAFQVWRGTGNVFDLSSKPPTQVHFEF